MRRHAIPRKFVAKTSCDHTVHFFTHPACLAHDTGPGHAERSERLVAVVDALREAFPAATWHEAPRASRGQLQRVHADALLSQVLETHPDTRLQLDPDTVLSPASAEAALRAAGAAVAATDAVLQDRIRRAFCAVRPPGHHAIADTAMGFCLFNNIAVAAAHARDAHGLERIAIADFDVHHGNGTQAIFESDPRVLFLSSHQLPLYPDSGFADERGIGNINNAPLPPGAGSAEFRAAWQTRLLPAIDTFRPQLLLISAGFDAHWRDPLAQLQLQADDYAWITRELVAIADRHANGRVVSMLEGGYDLDALRESSVAHVAALAA
jgi:acetoin utilization deacetylase AcuC-like enzyme